MKLLFKVIAVTLLSFASAAAFAEHHENPNVVIGQGAMAGTNGVAIGGPSNNSGSANAGNNGVAIGRGANAQSGVAIGWVAETGGTNAVAIGNSARATANRTVAVGNNAAASGFDAIAIGQRAHAGEDSIIIGGGGGVPAVREIVIARDGVDYDKVTIGNLVLQGENSLQSDVQTAQSNIQSIQSRATTLENNVQTIQSDVATRATQASVTTVAGNVSQLQSRATTLENNVQAIENDVATRATQASVAAVQSSVAAVTDDVSQLQTRATTMDEQIVQLQNQMVDLSGVNNRMDKLEDKLSGGIAMAMAMKSHTPPPGKDLNLRIATGFYNGASALGLSVTGRMPSDKYRQHAFIDAGIGYGENKFGGTIGVSFNW